MKIPVRFVDGRQTRIQILRPYRRDRRGRAWDSFNIRLKARQRARLTGLACGTNATPARSRRREPHDMDAGRYVSPQLAERMASYLDIDVRKAPHERLSNREFLILRLIASGLSVGQIARELSLSVSTISTYRSRLLQKMDMKHNAQLTSYAVQKGLVDY